MSALLDALWWLLVGERRVLGRLVDYTLTHSRLSVDPEDVHAGWQTWLEPSRSRAAAKLWLWRRLGWRWQLRWMRRETRRTGARLFLRVLS